MRCFLSIITTEANPLPAEKDAAWNRLFLLFRKLLAYGVHHAGPIKPALPYPQLQKISQKPDAMREALRVHLNDFDRLLTSCEAQHRSHPIP